MAVFFLATHTFLEHTFFDQSIEDYMLKVTWVFFFFLTKGKITRPEPLPSMLRQLT